MIPVPCHTGCVAIGALLALALPALAGEPHACILLYEIQRPVATCSNNTDIRAQRIAPDGAPMWRGGRGVSVAGTSDYERRPAAIPDGEGGAIVVFELKHNSGSRMTDVDICAQRISRDGRRLWNGGGPSVVASTRYREHAPVMVGDREGGAIVAFLVDVIVGEEKPLTGVCAQRIGPDGRTRWLGGARSVVIHEADARCAGLALAPDGEGGAFLAFRRFPAKTSLTSGAPRLLLHRVAADGELAWSEKHPGGMALGTPSANPRNIELVGDDRGGVWAIFEQGSIDRPSIVAQRIGPDAASAFDGAGVVVAKIAGSVPVLAGNPSTIPDGKGGIICVHGASTAAGTKRLHASRIGRDGKFVWGGTFGLDLLRVARARWEEYAATPAPNHALTVAFTTPVTAGRIDGHRALAAVRHDNLGKSLWGSKPLEVTNPSGGSARSPRVIPDGKGGVYIAYVIRFTSGDWEGDTSIFGLRLNSKGERVWKRPAPLAATTKPESRPVLVPSR